MIEVLLFILCSTVIAGGAFVLMYSEPKSKPMDKKPENPLNSNHPEVQEIKGDDELLVVNFDRDTRDPLNRSLQDRIDALNEGIDDEDEDDEDDDGDIVVVRH